MISLEPLAPGDFEIAARWLSQPEINRWLTSQWRNRIVDATLISMAVRHRTNRLFTIRYHHQPCGLIGLADIDVADKTAMVWYLLGESDLAGHGITSAAVAQLAQQAFGPMALRSLYAWIMSDNFPSRRVLEKARFREAGRIRQAAASAGTQVDRIYFDLVADQSS